MAKSRFFRVAVEGATTDGRSIEKQWLLDAAETYNRTTYAARVNLEHIRGITADGPFQAYGDVLSLKTETIDLTVGGKPEKRLALFAEIDALEPLVAMNKKAQKLYSSIEISPNFANTGKAYLVGLAVTDSPASLGTELLQFAAKAEVNPLAGRKQDPANLFSAAEETSIEIATATVDDEAAKGMFAKIAAFVDTLTAKKEEPAAPVVVEPTAAPDLAKSFAAIGETLTAMASTMQTFMSASATRAAAHETEMQAVKDLLEKTPANGFTRQPATGGGVNEVRTDC